MYAFAPTTTSKMCGIPNPLSPLDMNLYATLKKPKTISLSGKSALLYKQGSPDIR